MNKQSSDFSELDDLYQEIILDHYRSPRNQKKLDTVDIAAEGFNPFCGDKVLLSIKLEDNVVEQVSFEGNGCSISQASASMLTNLIKGETLDKARSLYSSFRELMHGTPKETLDDLGEAEALEGVRQFPIRIKCALLAWVALEDGIKKYTNVT
jgi:nitrogen fixation NifU-like protein